MDFCTVYKEHHQHIPLHCSAICVEAYQVSVAEFDLVVLCWVDIFNGVQVQQLIVAATIYISLAFTEGLALAQC